VASDRAHVMTSCMASDDVTSLLIVTGVDYGTVLPWTHDPHMLDDRYTMKFVISK